MRNLLITMALVGASALAGCSGGKAPAPKAGGTVVRLGYMPNVTHAAAIIGLSDAKGSYSETLPEASVEGKLFNAGPSIIEALRAGALDAAFIGPGPAINAYWRGGDIVILTNAVNGGSVLLARAGSDIKTVKDLAGKTVSVPQIGNTQDVLLRFQMADNGLRSSEDGGSVRVQPMENANILPLFQRDQLDAACVPEPWGSRLERQAGARVLLGSAQLFNDGNYSAALLVARKDFVTAHPEAVRALVRATDDITKRIAKDPQSIAPLLNREIQRVSGKAVPEEDIRRSLHRCRFTPDISRHEISVFANLVEVAGYKKDAAASLDGIQWK
jgi:NitT/TauT family transport system substrate-binding protein